MAPAKKTDDKTDAKDVPLNVQQGYVQELEGLEARKRALGEGDDNAGLKDNLDRRIGEVTDALGGKAGVDRARKRFGRVDSSGKPVERRPDDGDAPQETR